jgi:hypothetical protein
MQQLQDRFCQNQLNLRKMDYAVKKFTIFLRDSSVIEGKIYFVESCGEMMCGSAAVLLRPDDGLFLQDGEVDFLPVRLLPVVIKRIDDTH